MKLVFATNNKHKLAEAMSIAPSYMQILNLEQIACFEEIPETGETLEENAIIKAQHININYNQNCFADDTGLEVDALDGKPGVRTARYAGENADNIQNMQKLILEMQGEENRTARFRTIIALIIDGKQILFEGIIEGTIAQEIIGTNGFGYDPIFIPKGQTLTLAQLSAEEKNQISHRAQAINKLKTWLQQNKP